MLLYYRSLLRFKWRCGLSVLFIVYRYSKCLLIKHKGHIEFSIFFAFSKPPQSRPLHFIPTVHHTGFYTHYTRLALTRFYACHIIWYTLGICYSVHLASVFLYIIIYVICILYRNSAVIRPLFCCTSAPRVFCWLPIVLIRV